MEDNNHTKEELETGVLDQIQYEKCEHGRWQFLRCQACSDRFEAWWSSMTPAEQDRVIYGDE